MSLIPLMATWMLGWAEYRLIYRQESRISPLSLSVSWLLGAGAIHALYYISIVMFQTNPAPLLLILLALPGAVDFVLKMRQRQFDGWSNFRAERLATILLLLILAGMLLLTALHGFHADTARMWFGKVGLYDKTPDYVAVINNTNWSWHPGYPPLFTHQYQWQHEFTEDILGLKLPMFMFYLAMLGVIYTFLTRRYTVSRPILWLCLIAGMPIYWWKLPLGLADVPLSAYLIAGIYWLQSYHSTHQRRDIIVSGLMLGLMTLVKTEGLYSLGCLTITLLIMALFSRTQRTTVLKSIGYTLLIGGLIASSWLVILRVAGASDSDFALSAFAPDQLQLVLSETLPDLLNPVLYGFIWGIMLLLILMGFWQDAIIWMPALLYVFGLMGAYLFSVYPLGTERHIDHSYDRVIMQVLPLCMVYVAACLSSSRNSVYGLLKAKST